VRHSRHATKHAPQTAQKSRTPAHVRLTRKTSWALNGNWDRHGSVTLIAFRPLTTEDLPLMTRWLAQPHVARWWREDAGLAAVTARYLPSLQGQDPTELFVTEVDGSAAGLIQRYLVTDDPGGWADVLRATGTPGVDTAFGLDYLIGDPGLTGRGIGSAAIAEFTQLAFERYPGADSALVAVSQGNTASWRALEKAGFRRCWAGELASDDPSDEGPSYLYHTARRS
jgi:aminoglycoside 6'-N-acetyltransferase